MDTHRCNFGTQILYLHFNILDRYDAVVWILYPSAADVNRVRKLMQTFVHRLGSSSYVATLGILLAARRLDPICGDTRQDGRELHWHCECMLMPLIMCPCACVEPAAMPECCPPSRVCLMALWILSFAGNLPIWEDEMMPWLYLQAAIASGNFTTARYQEYFSFVNQD